MKATDYAFPSIHLQATIALANQTMTAEGFDKFVATFVEIGAYTAEQMAEAVKVSLKH